ncbi:MAG TPA: hypothetical protein VN853_08970 [Polyangia bacterium]|jgi:hypothetical protein|nr:hypothetical protein [Polyangia bacterium]
MSSHGTSNEHPPGHESEDAIDYKKVIGVGVASLFFFFLGTVWAVKILHHETNKAHATTGVPRTPDLGRAEIGIVDQVLFEGDHRLATWRAERSARLNGYGWVDRSKGIVHIPIERAMDEVASGMLPDGAPK